MKSKKSKNSDMEKISNDTVSRSDQNKGSKIGTIK